MENDKVEDIIAYRVADHFLCPACYELSVKILAVHEIKLLGEPVKKGDIKSFICNHCEDIKGDAKVLYIEKKLELEALQESVQQMRSVLPYRFREARSLLDLEDMIVNCNRKISFVSSFFIQKPPGQVAEMSEDDESGIYLILDQTREDLNFVESKISEMQEKGLIVEKEEKEARQSPNSQDLIQTAREAGRI